MTDDGLPDALIAEPGFSALVRVTTGGRERTILFDAGVTPMGVVENMRRLGLSAREVETIVLSHGHWDHVAGMEGIAKELGRASLLPCSSIPPSGDAAGSRCPGSSHASCPPRAAPR